MSNKKQQENEKAQKKGKNKRISDGSGKDRNGKGKRQDSRVKDSDSCPKHPHGSHTWGECRSRQQNQKPSFNKSSNKQSSKFGKDKQSNPTSSYVVATVEEAKSPSEGVTFPCFTIETLGQLDDRLTSDRFVCDTQLHPSEDAYVLDTYYTTMEDSLSVGDNHNDNDTGSYNALVISNLLPIGIMTIEFIQNKSFRRPLKVLFDSGSSRTLFNKDLVPPSVDPHTLSRPAVLHTGGGTTQIIEGVTLKQIRFPDYVQREATLQK